MSGSPTPFRSGDHVEAICRFEGSPGADGLLLFEKGEVIVFARSDPSGWAHGSIGTRSGWFPLQYVRAYTPPAVATPPALPPLPAAIGAGPARGGSMSARPARPQSALGGEALAPADPDRAQALGARKAVSSFMGSDIAGLISGSLRNPDGSPRTSPAAQLSSARGTLASASFSSGAVSPPPVVLPLSSSFSSSSAPSSPSSSSPGFTSSSSLSSLSSYSSSSAASSSSSSSSSSSMSGPPGLNRPPSLLGIAPGSSRARTDSLAMLEIRQLAEKEEASTEAVNQESITKKKGRTAVMLGTWLKTKRPTAEEMAQQGLLSTGGSLEFLKVKKTKDGIFGLELEELINAVPGRPIPIIVDQCVTYIRSSAMQTPGIFRVSPNNAELQAVRKLYKSPIEVIDLKKKTTSPHTVAALLKLWLQLLPEPLFSFDCYNNLMDLFKNVPPEARVRHISVFLNQLNQERRPIVTFLFRFLHELSQQSEVNKMTPSNLGIVFGPNLLKPKVQDQTTMLDRTNVEIVEFLVEHFTEWIDGIKP